MIVGDEGVGKTSLMKVFSPDAVVIICSGPGDVTYTSCEQTHAVEVDVYGQHFQLELRDTAGEEGFDRLRPLTYPCSDVFLVCFAIDSPASFSMVAKKWIPEVRHHCPHAPFILVGCKKDLRDDHANISEAKSTNETLVTTSQGQSLVAKIGAVAYLECSAERRQGVHEVFHTACRATCQQGPKQKRCTCIVQ